jgi:hypothetical protein
LAFGELTEGGWIDARSAARSAVGNRSDQRARTHGAAHGGRGEGEQASDDGTAIPETTPVMPVALPAVSNPMTKTSAMTGLTMASWTPALTSLRHHS